MKNPNAQGAYVAPPPVPHATHLATVAAIVRDPQELRKQAVMAYRDYHKRIVTDDELTVQFGNALDPNLGACLAFLVFRRVPGVVMSNAA